jgi:Flp pilus assembly protein CpaB
MKNIKLMGTLAVTAAGTLVAVLCASRWMSAQNASATKIAVAAVDIDIGQRLAPRFIKLIECPAGKIPPGAFSDPHKLDGRVLSASMLHGGPLTEDRLQPVRPSAIRLRPADLVTLAATRGEAKQLDLAGSVGLPSLKHDKQAVVRGDDPDTAAWLALLGEPWAPVMPNRAAKPAGA